MHNVEICGFGMLRSFGRGLRYIFGATFCKKNYKYFAVALKAVFVQSFIIKAMHKNLYTLREKSVALSHRAELESEETLCLERSSHKCTALIRSVKINDTR